MPILKPHVLKYNSDNYSYLIQVGNDYSILVDPGSPTYSPELTSYPPLEHILITHGHIDHIAGLSKLTETYPNVSVYAHKAINAEGNYFPLKPGEPFKINDLEFETFGNYAHSRDHLAFKLENHIFVGDILFSAGCGRFFSKDGSEFLKFAQWLENLDDDHWIYFGHEYTRKNLEFCLEIDPHNSYVHSYLEKFEFGYHSTPTSLGLERKVNPYLRYNEPAIVEFARDYLKNPNPSPAEIIDAIRHAKDNF